MALSACLAAFGAGRLEKFEDLRGEFDLFGHCNHYIMGPRFLSSTSVETVGGAGPEIHGFPFRSGRGLESTLYFRQSDIRKGRLQEAGPFFVQEGISAGRGVRDLRLLQTSTRFCGVK